jgi:hypothetical protein
MMLFLHNSTSSSYSSLKIQVQELILLQGDGVAFGSTSGGTTTHKIGEQYLQQVSLYLFKKIM